MAGGPQKPGGLIIRNQPMSGWVGGGGGGGGGGGDGENETDTSRNATQLPPE